KGVRQYRYYVCTRAQKTGYTNCPCPSLRADSIEQSVLEKLRSIPFDQHSIAASPIAEAAAVLLSGCQEIPSKHQAAALQLVVERVEHDGRTARIGITLTPAAAECVTQRASA